MYKYKIVITEFPPKFSLPFCAYTQNQFRLGPPFHHSYMDILRMYLNKRYLNFTLRIREIYIIVNVRYSLTQMSCGSPEVVRCIFHGAQK